MTVSVRRMTLGAGYRYLMSSVARGDGDGRAVSALTRYYAESGTPPGRFAGAGLAGLADGVGVEAGSVVGEGALQRMLGGLQDPITGRYLGRPPLLRSPYVDANGVEHAAAKPVAAFDLTFSVPKSVSVAWALADGPTREAVYGAHRAAVERVLRFAEEQVFCSRVGKAGAAQVDVRGVVAAVFDHWDSRAGDPQLHSHVVVLNRAQGVDGKWRTLDSRAVFRSTVALSELYNGVLSDYLTAALGWGWEPVARRHSTVPKYEVAGVPAMLRDEFSRRSSAIEDAKNALVDRFARDHGREPTAPEVLKLRQTATLATRPGKQVRPLAELVDGWRARAETFLDGVDPGEWAAGLTGRNDLPLLRAGGLDPGMLADLAAVTLNTVGSRRATFTRANLLAEAARQLHGARFATPEDRVAVVGHVTDTAAGRAVLLTGAPIPDPGVGARRGRLRDPVVFATVEVLDAETRLLDAARSLDGPAVDPAVAEQALQGRRAGGGPSAVGRPAGRGPGGGDLPAGGGRAGGRGGHGQDRGHARGPGGVGGAVRGGVGGRARAVRGRRRRPRRRGRHPHREHDQVAHRRQRRPRPDGRAGPDPAGAVAGQPLPGDPGPARPRASVGGRAAPVHAVTGPAGDRRRGVHGRHRRPRHHHHLRPGGGGEGAPGGGLGPAVPGRRRRRLPPPRRRPRRHPHAARRAPLPPRMGTHRLRSAPRRRPGRHRHLHRPGPGRGRGPGVHARPPPRTPGPPTSAPDGPPSWSRPMRRP